MDSPTTVADYLASLPDDRRAEIAQVRDVVRAHLPAGYEEGIQYGMIAWFVPLSRYPNTYNGYPLTIASLGSQRNYMALYLMGVYGDAETQRWFVEAYAKTGKKLDMGKSCVRFRTVGALALDVIGEVIARRDVDSYIASYEASRATKAAATTEAKPAATAIAKPVAVVKPAAKPIVKAAVKPAIQKSAAKPAPKKPAPKKPAPKKPAAKPAAKKRAPKATAKKRPAKRSSRR